MNFHVYNQVDILGALDAAADSKDMKTLVTPGGRLTLDYKGKLHITYPCASLWHQKIDKVLSMPSVDPKSADAFIVPVAIMSLLTKESASLVEAFCHALPYWQYHKKRHVIFDIGDLTEVDPEMQTAAVFKVSADKKKPYLPLYYDVLLDNSYITPFEDATYKCSFVGCLTTHPIRHEIPYCINKFKEPTYIESTPDFFANIRSETRIKMQKNWQQILNDSQFILCPRGHGLNSIRFYEAMAFARIPVLIADETKLPLENIINYEKFVVFVPEKDISNTYTYIKRFEEENDLKTASSLAHETWKTYFTTDALPGFIEKSLSASIKHQRKMFI